MEKILVGVDGSSFSDEAAGLAAEIAEAFRAKLIVAHAMPEVRAWAPRVPESTAAGWELAVRDHADTLLAETETALLAERPQLAIEKQLLSGPAALALTMRASAVGADLVVVGHRGHGRLEGLLLGSVAHQVAEIADQPVLVARGRVQPLRGAVIAVGVDGSSAAVTAAEQAAKLAAAVGARLLVAHAAPKSTAATMETRNVVAKMAGVLERAAHRPVGDRLLHGDAVDALCNLAEEPEVALIVVGRKGTSAALRLLLGSVANGLLQLAPKPVLIVR